MINEKIYYDNDADISHIKDKSVGTIGCGIHVRSQALNLPDSGINVLVSNEVLHLILSDNIIGQNIVLDGGRTLN